MDTRAIIIIVVVSSSVLVGILFVYLFFLKKRVFKKALDELEKPVVKIDNNSWKESLGGEDNIKGVELKGSRLIVSLENNSKIDKDALHDLGATSIIISEQKVTLVIKEDAEKVLNLLK